MFHDEKNVGRPWCHGHPPGRMDDEGMLHLATLTMLNPDVLFGMAERLLPVSRSWWIFRGRWFFGTLFGGIETRTPGKKTNRNHGFWSLLLMVFDGFWWFLMSLPKKKSLIRCLGPKNQPQIRSQKVFKSVGYGFSIGPPIAIMRGERGPWWY